MSEFIENFAQFLSECKNNATLELNNNRMHSEMKSKSLKLSEKLLNTIPSEEMQLVIRLLDNLSAINIVETTYYYLCGIQCGMREDNTSDLPAVINVDLKKLFAHKKYTHLSVEATTSLNELEKILNAESLTLLKEYRKIKKTMWELEKSHYYTRGINLRRLLDNLFKEIDSNKCDELIDAFL